MPGRLTNSIRSTGMKADKSFSLWILRHRYTVVDDFFNAWLSYDLFIPWVIESIWFTPFALFLPIFHHHLLFNLLPPCSVSLLHWINFSLVVVCISFLLASCCAFSCLISRGWTSQGSSQTWSHLRSVSAVVLWSAVMTWPLTCRDALVRRVTASSPM